MITMIIIHWRNWRQNSLVKDNNRQLKTKTLGYKYKSYEGTKQETGEEHNQ